MQVNAQFWSSCLETDKPRIPKIKPIFYSVSDNDHSVYIQKTTRTMTHLNYNMTEMMYKNEGKANNQLTSFEIITGARMVWHILIVIYR